MIHVRDLLLKDETAPAESLARPAFVLKAKTPIYEALASMRAASVQIAVVTDGSRITGVVTLADILRRVLPLSPKPEPRGLA